MLLVDCLTCSIEVLHHTTVQDIAARGYSNLKIAVPYKYLRTDDIQDSIGQIYKCIQK